jgi:hypothetical protein
MSESGADYMRSRFAREWGAKRVARGDAEVPRHITLEQARSFVAAIRQAGSARGSLIAHSIPRKPRDRLMTRKQSAQQVRAREIEWASAEVRDGVLIVELSADGPKGWGKDFNAVLALLQSGNQRWGTVRLRKNVIEVADVLEGSEEELRHLLESVVLQVNSDLQLDAGDEVSAGRGEDAAESDRAARQAADRAITATFRSFAEPDA